MKFRSCFRTGLMALAVALLAAGSAPPAAARPSNTGQPAFATPEAATDALAAAIRSGDEHRIVALLGPGSGKVVRSGDAVADRHAGERFIAAYDKRATIERNVEGRATLLIGDNDWPFPFPLVQHADGWRFDARSGAAEILDRRIGRNELSAIQVCLAYVDAQREYAAARARSGAIPEYASKLESSPGTHDGLYWPTAEGEPLSPLGPLVAKARSEGYESPALPYHGYYYRILTAQGAHAAGGAYNYRVRSRMMGGFALVAYPAQWGASGVMTFIVNHDGAVYQKNLGRTSAALASKTTRFDPDPTWSPVKP